MNLINEIIKNMYEQKEILNKLISIDNEKMFKKNTLKEYINTIKEIFKEEQPFYLKQDTLFITEGNPLLTLKILQRLDEKNNYIIFINQNYVAMNKWLINEYQKITGNNHIELDTNINYNDYIKLNYKVIPIGEENLTKQVLEDFND